MSGKMSRNKGLNFERHIVKKLKEIFPNACRALVGSLEDNVKKIDFRNTGRLCIQAKRLRNYASARALSDIQADNGGISVLWTKADRQPEVVMMYADDFLRIIKDIGEVYYEDKEGTQYIN